MRVSDAAAGMYGDDEYGARILRDLQEARRFNAWLADVLRPHLGRAVLELGAGIGTLTRQFLPRDLYVATDINPLYLRALESYAVGQPTLRVERIDAENARDFASFTGMFDTVLMINVLEHVRREHEALRNVFGALQPGGRAVILVPQGPALFNSLDAVLQHRERYTASGLRSSLERAGFRTEQLFDFNRLSVPAWFLNGSVLRRKQLPRVQLRLLDVAMPVVRRLDHVLPWRGLSIIGIGRRP